MNVLKRFLGAYSLVMAAAVAVFFCITPLYDDGSTGYPTWVILNWLMTPAVVIACWAGITWKLELNKAAGGESDLKQYIGVNALFYSALILGLWFFSNWLADMVGEEVELLWSFIDPLYVVVTGACGVRLWRSAGSG